MAFFLGTIGVARSEFLRFAWLDMEEVATGYERAEDVRWQRAILLANVWGAELRLEDLKGPSAGPAEGATFEDIMKQLEAR